MILLASSKLQRSKTDVHAIIAPFAVCNTEFHAHCKGWKCLQVQEYNAYQKFKITITTCWSFSGTGSVFTTTLIQQRNNFQHSAAGTIIGLAYTWVCETGIPLVFRSLDSVTSRWQSVLQVNLRASCPFTRLPSKAGRSYQGKWCLE